MCSVTRFGKISPFWPTFKLIWQHLEGLFSIWHNFESTPRQLLNAFGLMFIVLNRHTYNEKTNLTSGHTECVAALHVGRDEDGGGGPAQRRLDRSDLKSVNIY